MINMLGITSTYFLLIIFLIITFLQNKIHVMSTLIILECMAIVMIMMMFIMISKMNIENFVVFYVLILSISESIVGITLMISMIRTHSNELLMSNSVMKL